VIAHLERAGLAAIDAEALAGQWLIYGDFLLIPFAGRFDVVIGNPPYVRQEMIADALMSEYRARYCTIYDRADIYIPFIERSLQLLSRRGQLGFICADRWMKNRYGGPLRQLVADAYHLKIYVDMVDTPALPFRCDRLPGHYHHCEGKAGCDTDRLSASDRGGNPFPACGGAVVTRTP
jgi:hypothetical protein